MQETEICSEESSTSQYGTVVDTLALKCRVTDSDLISSVEVLVIGFMGTNLMGFLAAQLSRKS